MLDLHSHILPGIDDGAGSVEESVTIARRMAAENVRAVAATPHCRQDHPSVVPGELADRCESLERELRAQQIPLRVLPAGELDLVWALEASDDDLRLASYCQRGNDLLVETPYGPLPSSFEDLLFSVAMKGYRIMLAHPERNPSLQDDPGRLAELVRRGTLVQVTASSLVRSPKGSRSATAAHDWTRKGLVHVIASDTHGGAAPERPSLRAGSEVALEMVGTARTRWLVSEVPAAILEGAPLPPQPEAAPPKKATLRARLGL